MGRVFGLVIGIPSCLISSAAIVLCQKMGWQSDGPGLMCPLSIGFIFGLIGLSSMWSVLTSGEPPKN
jgi:hypothetical protein